MQLRQKLHPVREDDNEDVDDGLPYRQFAEYLDDDAPAEDESDGDVDMYEWDETTLYEHFLSDEYVWFLVTSLSCLLVSLAESRKKQNATE
jgi:hypothetical protein